MKRNRDAEAYVERLKAALATERKTRAEIESSQPGDAVPTGKEPGTASSIEALGEAGNPGAASPLLVMSKRAMDAETKLAKLRIAADRIEVALRCTFACLVQLAPYPPDVAEGATAIADMAHAALAAYREAVKP